MQRKLVAEFVGTFALVFLAVGTAVVGVKTHGTGFVALAFGFVLVLGVYAIGPGVRMPHQPRGDALDGPEQAHADPGGRRPTGSYSSSVRHPRRRPSSS